MPLPFGNLVGLSGTNLANALTQLSGEVGTGAERTSFNLMTQFMSLMTDPYAVGFAPSRVTPYAAVQSQWFHTPSYSESDLTGGGFGLTYDAMTANDTRSELGARFDDLIDALRQPADPARAPCLGA